MFFIYLFIFNFSSSSLRLGTSLLLLYLGKGKDSPELEIVSAEYQAAWIPSQTQMTTKKTTTLQAHQI